LSAHSAGLAPAGLHQARGEAHVPSPNNWSLQLGKKAAVREEPIAKVSLPPTLLTNTGSDCWLIPLLSDMASQPSSQGRRLDECTKLSGCQKKAAGCVSFEIVLFSYDFCLFVF